MDSVPGRILFPFYQIALRYMGFVTIIVLILFLIEVLITKSRFKGKLRTEIKCTRYLCNNKTIPVNLLLYDCRASHLPRHFEDDMFGILLNDCFTCTWFDTGDMKSLGKFA